MNDRLPETILIRMSDGKTMQAANYFGIHAGKPAYALPLPLARRWIVECEWSGYRAGQARICHRKVISPKEARRYEKITGVEFTDNTRLNVVVRPLMPREQVKEINGYSELFQDIFRSGKTGYVRIIDLPHDSA